MKMKSYAELLAAWPPSGRHILASYDDTSLVVYQAFKPSIAEFAAKHRRFGGEFNFHRMSWIKPNFLWMMFRSNWAQKPDQERILAITLRRAYFDELLAAAVPSSWSTQGLGSREEWHKALEASDVRLQWDPDHDAAGKPLARRAIQIGLRGQMLRRYATAEPLAITDITETVATLRAFAGMPEALLLPYERVYLPTLPAARKAGMDGV